MAAKKADPVWDRILEETRIPLDAIDLQPRGDVEPVRHRHRPIAAQRLHVGLRERR